VLCRLVAGPNGAPGLARRARQGGEARRLFPRDGSADDVRARFSSVGADGDAFEALDDAERAYERQLR
jgi:hypothetical protein